MDANGDGIGDTPYDVNAGEGIQDPYPLMKSQEWYYIFEGDWIVTGEESHFNKIITLIGSLIIQPGGNLTLSNVILRFNCSIDGQFYLEVNGGNLTVRGESVITSVNILNAWYLQANVGSLISLVNSTFSYAGWEIGTYGDHSGLWINANNTQIVNCTIHNNYYGLALYQVNNSLIANNTIISNIFYGIYQRESSFNNFTNNILEGNTDYTVYLFNCHNNSFRYNSFSNNDGDGLKIYYSTNNTFIGNVIYNNNGTGLDLSFSSHNNTLINNTIDKNIYYGIYVSESSYNRIINNTVSNNGQWHAGIRLIAAANFTFLSDNTFYNNTYYGIFVDSCSNTTIISNIISENSRYGIWLYNGSFTLSENNTVSYNTIFNNVRDGIRLEGHVNTLISYNIISDNIQYGIFLGTNSINTTVLWNNFRNNNQGSTQGYDSGINNEFSYNYWDDHIGIDADVDGIYDNVYSISGDSNFDPNPRTHPYFPHAIIYINHEANFTALGFPGQGTISDPYIIEECFINDIGISLIHIENVSAYFIIRFNLLIGKAGGNAINLVNCTHGLIIDNNVQNTTIGIQLFESSNNTISGNIVTNMIYGFLLTNGSSSNIVYDNRIYNNSIGITLSFDTINNNISSNLICNNSHIGIYLFCAENNIINNNTIYNQFDDSLLGHGIAILTYKHLRSDHNTIVNNSIYNNY